MIDEKRLIKELEKIFETDEQNIDCTLSDFAYHVFDCIENQPKVSEWIPCSERLPEKSGTYEVTAYDAKRLIITYVKWQPKMKSWNLTGARSYWKIIAWRERPEPYRPEGGNQ